MAQVRQVVSEALQSTVRRLLPSQQGFTEDLQASNVITPIIDLTPSAEGSALRADLASAYAFDDVTALFAQNSAVVAANTPGFYKVQGTFTMRFLGTSSVSGTISMSDGLSTKVLWKIQGSSNGSTSNNTVTPYENTFFLSSGDSLSIATDDADCFFNGSVRQIADVNGLIDNPTQFVSQ